MSKQTEVCTDPKVGQRFIDLDHNGKAICTLTYICTNPKDIPTGAGKAVNYYLVFDQEPNLSISGVREMSRDNFIARQINGRIVPVKDETPMPEKLKNSDSHIKPKYSHYLKDPTGYGAIDVYRLLRMFEVTDHEIGHAVKKLLVSGKRGAKGKRQDLIEAIDTLNRLLTIMDEDEALGKK